MSDPTMRREIYIGPGQEFVVKAAGDPLSEVLDAVVAEGHLDVRIQRWDGWADPAQMWSCTTDMSATTWHGGSTEQFKEWQFANHYSEMRGATPMEAAQKRLDQIRLGKSLTWLAFAAPNEAPFFGGPF